MRVLAVADAKTACDHQQVADVLREGMLLLQDPAVHQQSALEDLILRAPYCGGLESWLHKKAHFHLGKDLPHYITAREGRGGLSVK